MLIQILHYIFENLEESCNTQLLVGTPSIYLLPYFRRFWWRFKRQGSYTLLRECSNMKQVTLKMLFLKSAEFMMTNLIKHIHFRNSLLSTKPKTVGSQSPSQETFVHVTCSTPLDFNTCRTFGLKLYPCLTSDIEAARRDMGLISCFISTCSKKFLHSSFTANALSCNKDRNIWERLQYK